MTLEDYSGVVIGKRGRREYGEVLRKLTVGSLFSGIGGFEIGLERAGMETKWQVEIDNYAAKILEKHWPDVKRYRDVREVGAHNLEPVDLICGGFPCQDISLATPPVDGYGRGRGLDGAKSGLWSECARILRELRPRWAIFENVPNLLNGEGGDWFKRVLWDIYKIGYDAEWHCISAANVGLPHIRTRIFIIAYPRESRLQGLFQPNSLAIPQFNNERQPRDSINRYNNMGVSCIPEDIRMDDGVSNRLDRAKALGNAVVPQIPEIIGRAIMEIENANS